MIAAFTATIVIWRLRKSRSMLRWLDLRESLSDDEIFERYYFDRGLEKKAVLEIWHEIADTLGLPAAQLRPTDRFGQDIGAYLLTSEAIDALSTLALKRCKRQGLALNLSTIKTVDEYVVTMVSPKT